MSGGRGCVGAKGPWLPPARYWRGNGPEWDIVSMSVDRKHLLVGECKWADKPLTPARVDRVVEDLLRKGTPPIKGADSCRIMRCVCVPAVTGKGAENRSAAVITADAVMRITA